MPIKDTSKEQKAGNAKPNGLPERPHGTHIGFSVGTRTERPHSGDTGWTTRGQDGDNR